MNTCRSDPENSNLIEYLHKLNIWCWSKYCQLQEFDSIITEITEKSVDNNEIEGWRRRKIRWNYDTKNDHCKFFKKRMDANGDVIVTQSSMDTDRNQGEEIIDIDLHFLKVFKSIECFLINVGYFIPSQVPIMRIIIWHINSIIFYDRNDESLWRKLWHCLIMIIRYLQSLQMTEMRKDFGTNEFDLIFPERQNLQIRITNRVTGFNGRNEIMVQVQGFDTWFQIGWNFH